MKREERLDKIKKAHQRYVDWWLPIDVASGSLVAPMSRHRFCESLLTYSDQNWFDRWLPDYINITEKNHMKRWVLEFIIAHYTHIINLNENE